MPFDLVSPFIPRGDQPQAIDLLCRHLLSGNKHHVLLGVTGSGKTFTMAQVIARLDRPSLVIAPNKTLAAQLYSEFRSLFPNNAVEYFVSYYDYYQPEAYIPTSDTYIQKDSSINETIDKMRHSATMSVLTRRDVLVVASVSCIYGLGAPEDYLAMRVPIECGTEMPRDVLLRSLVAIQYERNDMDFHRGVFRVRGDRVEIFPAYEEDKAIRVEFFGDEIDGISEIDPLRGTVLKKLSHTAIFPASHYVTQKTTLQRAVNSILAELKEQVAFFRQENKLIEAQRIEERTHYDIEMMMEIGYCNGIENYSRHLTGRLAGEPPPTLLDYFPEDYLVFFDESHIAVPQIARHVSGRPIPEKHPGSIWIPAAVRPGQPPPEIRGIRRRGSIRWSMFRQRPRTTKWKKAKTPWSSRLSGPPDSSILKSRCEALCIRWMIFWRKSENAPSRKNACWSPP